MESWLDFARRLLPPSLKQPSARELDAEFVVLSSLCMALIGLLNLLAFLFYMPPSQIWLCVLGIVLHSCVILSLYVTGSVTIALHLSTAILYSLVMLGLYCFSGYKALAPGWLIVVPLYAGFLGGISAAGIWGGLICMALLSLSIYDQMGFQWPQTLSHINELTMLTMNALGISALIGFIALVHGFKQAMLTKRNLQHLQEKHQAEQANIAKSRFLAQMSHELRTPLNTVLGYTDILLEDEDLKELYTRDLRKIRSAGDHLLSIVNELLDLAKIEAGEMKLNIRPFSPSRLLDDVAAQIQPQLQEGQNQLNIEKTALPEEWLSDEQKLRQVLLNLLSNATKFTTEGVITLRAESHPDKDQPVLYLSVKDSGIGMTAQELEQVFEPYKQGEAGTTHEYSTGLGLPISRHYCRMLGGELEAQSQPGTGTNFQATIPKSQMDASNAKSE